jgi:hypothetical protein
VTAKIGGGNSTGDLKADELIHAKNMLNFGLFFILLIPVLVGKVSTNMWIHKAVLCGW